MKSNEDYKRESAKNDAANDDKGCSPNALSFTNLLYSPPWLEIIQASN